MASLPRPPLEDPTSLPEIFASECAGVSYINGNIVVTLANVRPADTATADNPKFRRFVVGRFALSNQAARQFLAQLQQVMAQIESKKQRPS
jgi:hypothetical protein